MVLVYSVTSAEELAYVDELVASGIRVLVAAPTEPAESTATALSAAALATATLSAAVRAAPLPSLPAAAILLCCRQ